MDYLRGRERRPHERDGLDRGVRAFYRRRHQRIEGVPDNGGRSDHRSSDWYDILLAFMDIADAVKDNEYEQNEVTGAYFARMEEQYVRNGIVVPL